MNAPYPSALPILAPVAKIHRSPSNPRKRFNPDAHADMVASVKEHGVLQPVLLRPLPMDHGPKDMPMSEKLDHFELVSGERRWRAATEAKLTEILAVVRDLTDVQVLEIQIIENLQREDVHPLEEAEGYERLMKQGNYTLEHLMERIGKSRSYVYARLKLLALITEAREAFYKGQLNPSTALLIARIPAGRQIKALDEIVKGYGREPMSFRTARDHIEQHFMLDLTKAPFKPDDDRFAAGPCTQCPKRTGNQPELFSDIASGDMCTDSACYTDKREVNYLRLKEIAEAKGAKVIEGKAAEKIAPHGAQYLESKEYVSLEKTCYDVPKAQSYSKLLGKDFTPDTYIKDPRTGALVPVASKATIAEHLAAKGITIQTGTRSDEEKERERKAKAETAYREALLRTISEHLKVGYDPSPSDLRLIAACLLERIGHDARKRLEKLFGERDMATMETHQLHVMLLQCALISEAHVASYQTIGKPENLLAIATELDIDHAQIKRDIQKSLKPAPKNGKKSTASATKSAATPSPAAQAADLSASKKPAAPAQKINADEKPGEEADPAPASPGNEKPAAKPQTTPKPGQMFCHPDNPDLKWMGKGRPPAWAKALMDAGRGLEVA